MSESDSAGPYGEGKDRRTLQERHRYVNGELRFFELRAQAGEVAHAAATPADAAAQLTQEPFAFPPDIAAYIVGKYLHHRTTSERAELEAEQLALEERLRTMPPTPE